MSPEDPDALLARLKSRRAELAIHKDLSEAPEWFGRELKIRGLYVWGRAFGDESRALSEVELLAILYNETLWERVSPPEGYALFRLRDLNDVAYFAAVKPFRESRGP